MINHFINKIAAEKRHFFAVFFAKNISKLFIKIDVRGSSRSRYYTKSKTL